MTTPTAQSSLLPRHTDRLAVLNEILVGVSRATTPQEVQRAFAANYWRLRPIDAYVSLSTRGLEAGAYKVTRALRFEHAGDDPHHAMANQDPWGTIDRLPVHTGGLLGQIIATPGPQLLTDLDLRDDPVLGGLIGPMGSCVACPLFDDGDPLNWSLTFRADPQGLTHAELEDAFLVSNLVGTATRTLLSSQRALELAGQLERQFEEVARVQRSLLPQRNPSIPGLSIATSYLTSTRAGGDYYDFIELPGGRWAILIADVSGHGPGAATVMAMLHTILHAYPGPRFDPGAILEHANDRLMHARLEGTFVTAFLGVYDPADASFVYARAGHNPPRCVRGSGGEIALLEGDAVVPLGVFEALDPPSNTLILTPGDTIVLYTDGITEAFDAQMAMFSIAGLNEALRGCSCEPDCVVDSIHRGLYEHTGVRTRADDQTLVVIQYRGTDP